MTEKKTKKKTRKSRKKTGVKKTTKRKKTKAADESATQNTLDATVAEQTTDSNTETESKPTRLRRDSSTRKAKKKATRTKRKSTRKTKKDETAETAVEAPTGPDIEEGEDGAIVVHFPPAAPPPFLNMPTFQDGNGVLPAVEEPEVADTEEAADSEPEPEPEPQPEPESKHESPAELSAPPEEPEVLAAEEPRKERRRRGRGRGRGRGRESEDTPEEHSGRRLSASQKRRLRRQRQREQRDPTIDEPEETIETTEPDEEERALEAAELIEAADSEASLHGDLEIEPAPEELRDEDPTEDVDEAPEEDAPPAKDKRRRRRRRGRRSAPHEPPEPAAREDTATEPREEPRKKGKRPVREMIINTIPREECRIALLNKGKLEEIYFERATSESHVGNIYKGIVTNVEPSIQAAFIDFGQGKNGFLHISDLHPQYFPDGVGHTENVGHKMPRRHRPPIQRCLRRGQEVLVQVTKEGIGTKGPTLSTYLSIPGRFLVMMPGMRRLGVSRRIEDEEARESLRKLLNELDLADGMGFIARTAALDRNKRELQSDLSYLQRLWRAVEKRIDNEPAPAELYRESDLVIRTIRDVFTSDVERIVFDDPDVAERAREFLSIFSPRSKDIVALYDDPTPIFHKYGIEAELERLHSRHVPLKSGGSLVIDQTEALVAIDVNSGRFRTEDDAEQTAYKMNVEAADEIPRQLRLRDLGGVVVCDFIDMRQESHRRDIERRLINNLKAHKERAKVLRMSSFGIIELTRQRQRASLMRSIYQDCRHCRGTGLVKTVESVALDVMRLVQLAVSRDHINMIEVSVSTDVAFLLQNRKRRLIADLERQYRRTVFVRPEPGFSLDQVEIRCTDSRGRLVPHT